MKKKMTILLNRNIVPIISHFECILLYFSCKLMIKYNNKEENEYIMISL